MTSAHITSSHHRGPSPANGAVGTRSWPQAAAALALRVVTWPARVAAARAAMNQLAGMSDHELRDIGLTRQDLRDATGLVQDADPTQMLAQRVAGRTRFWR